MPRYEDYDHDKVWMEEFKEWNKEFNKPKPKPSTKDEIALMLRQSTDLVKEYGLEHDAYTDLVLPIQERIWADLGLTTQQRRNKHMKAQKYAKERRREYERYRTSKRNATPAVLDSGASQHFFSTLSRFQRGSLTKPEEAKTVMTSDGTPHPVVGVGRVGHFHDVNFVEGLDTDMISAGKLCDDGHAIILTKDAAYLAKPNAKRLGAKIASRAPNGLYNVDESMMRACIADTRPYNELELWHNRLGHYPPRAIFQALQNGTITGIKTKRPLHSYNKNYGTCRTCARAKLRRKQMNKNTSTKKKAKRPFQMLAMDTLGPVKTQTPEGHTYALVIIDIYSNAINAYPLRRKSDAAGAFADFHKTVVCAHTTDLIETIRSDGARDLCEGEMKDLFDELKIKVRETTAPHSSYQNSRAERAIQHIQNVTRALMNHTHVPETEWGEAMKYASIIINTMPCSANPGHQSPNQRIAGTETPTSVAHFKTFYCPVFYVFERPKKERFLPRGELGFFVGFDGPNHKSIKIRTKTRKLIKKADRETYFLEDIDAARTQGYTAEPNLKSQTSYPLAQQGETGSSPESSDEEMGQDEPTRPTSPSPPVRQPKHASNTHESTKNSNTKITPKMIYERTKQKKQTVPIETELNENTAKPRYPGRTRKPNTTYTDVQSQELLLNRYKQQANLCDQDISNYETNYFGYTTTQNEPRMASEYYTPKTYQDAMTCDDADHWTQSIMREYDNLWDHNTWELVNPPQDKKGIDIIKAKEIFKVKQDENGHKGDYRTRIVAGGYGQTSKTITSTWAPTLLAITLRLVLFLIAAMNLYAMEYDIKSAYLMSDLDVNNLFIRPPPGFRRWARIRLMIDDIGNKLLHLIRPLYGTRNGAACFNRKLHNTLSAMGFKRCTYDSALYYKHTTDQGQRYLTICATFVDDGIIAGERKKDVQQAISQLQSTFSLGKCRRLQHFLNLNIQHDTKTGELTVSAKNYAKQIARTFHVENSRPIKTPFPPGLYLTKVTKEAAEEKIPDLKMYQRLVGSLNYLCQTVRGDIAYPIHKLARFMAKPTNEAWQTAKRVLKYAYHSRHLGLRYHRVHHLKKNLNIDTYTDSDYAQDINTRKSCSAYIICINDQPITYRSALQKLVSLSSCEAEYIAACEAAQATMSLANLLNEIGLTPTTKPTIHMDNQSAITLTTRPGFQRKTKHVPIKYHYLKDLATKEKIKIQYIPGADNPADILTKPVTTHQFQRHRDLLVRNLESDQQEQTQIGGVDP